MTIVYVALVLYMRNGWASISTFVTSDATPSTTVSVLIAARNEEQVIERTINCLLNQDYPKELLEIIVIDDHSTDRTAEIVRLYAVKGVKLLQMNESDKLNSYKKKAISNAIDIAQGEIIVTTDADCRMGRHWLSTVVGFLRNMIPIWFHHLLCIRKKRIRLKKHRLWNSSI
ncbi:glycosyltransferase, group 2 family protein [Sphingobacterium spiritivorum ATCC 33300]|uniref:Glycosyltransferase, group 2 family protein n=1 Tax=Sphingobacterium spiritivorum ATCC 33300 TaxID=525372 RepID=C2G019_SPHSI|nr:glycosyltransferase [Sphingobacterium spiritivorum]EEI91615.1 glycosyltransferase, group 2 family protein [Sphingobacterium spiritivorum ATCC 33300]